MKIVIKGKVFKHIVIVAKNGEILLSSEIYYSKSNCVRAAKKLAKELGLKIGKNDE